MEIRILGNLEVESAGLPIVIRRPRERALLTMLAAEPGRVVSVDRLIDGLWGESVPASATKTLQTYIHHLRSLLPEGSIATESPGYRLTLGADEIDAHRFASRVRDAQALAATEPEAAASQLEVALSLWRGSPMPDAEAGWLRPLQARLEALRLESQIQLAELRIGQGRHEEVMADLAGLLEEHPLREDLWSLHMLALYRAGRQADALRAYGEARRWLAEELGIEPGPQLAGLEQRILEQDPELAPPSSLRVPAVTPKPEVVREEESSPGLRYVNVVQVELTGAEAVFGRVDEPRARRAMEEAIRAIVSVVGRFGGSVVSRGQEGVTATVGLPVAREDDTHRTIRMGLAVVDAMAEHAGEMARAWDVEGVGAKVAVTSASTSAPFEWPDAQIEVALRDMLLLAKAGDVVVDDHSRSLMGEAFDWTELPVPTGAPRVWRAGHVREEGGKARMGRRLHAPLIGREAELVLCGEAVAALRKGVGGILVVSGEAGVGKTRLVSEMRSRHAESDVTWMVGHGAPYGEATPYWPFRDMLRSWIGVGIDDQDLSVRIALHQRLEEALADHAASLYPYLGGLLGIKLEPDQTERLQLAPEALQYRTFEVVRTVLQGLSAGTPLGIVLEDVHWADSTSVALCHQLLDLTEDHALLVVLTTRPDPDHPSWQLVEAARHKHPHRTTEVALRSLGGEAERTLLHALVGADGLPDRVTDQILRLAEGNPFYLEELVGSLIDQGALVSSGSGWELRTDVDLAVPETIERVVQARIDSLEPSAREVITSASVLGRSFGLPLLRGVVGDVSIGVLQSLLRLDLLVEAARWPQAEYLFRHALIQEAAYRTLTDDRRVALHRRAAEWLEKRYVDGRDEVIGLLARHWNAAGDEDRAVAALVRAGDLARRDHALDEAIGHYRRLLPILERRGDRRNMALVLLKLGLALHQALRFSESNEAYQRAFVLWEYQPSPGATESVRFASPPFVDVPDPVRSFMLPDIQLQMALFDRLVERWPDDTLVPSLARSWDISDDGLTYRFQLREGLTWSDGQPLTASDVAFGIERNLDPDSPGVGVAMFYVIEGALEHVRAETGPELGIRALDPLTVEIRLVNPAPYLLAMLNRPDAGPQPRHAIEGPEDWTQVEHEVVSGAFGRAAHTAERTVLDRRTPYPGSRQGNVQRVEWTHGDPEEIVQAYARGRVDLAWISGAANPPGLASVPTSEALLGPAAGLYYLAFVADFADPQGTLFRRALAHGIDRGVFGRSLPGHITAATGGMVPPALAGHTPDIALPFDPKRGRDLLAESGAPPRVRVAVPHRPDLHVGPTIQAVADMWRRHLELEVEVVDVDTAGWWSVLDDPSGFDLIPATWFPGYTDPEYFLRLLLHSEASSNYGGFSYAPYDELVERACRATEERTRLELFHQADRMAVAEVVAVIPLTYHRNISLSRPEVKGWWEFGKSWANFADLVVDSPKT